MSQPSDQELTRLNRIAEELREVFAERGHRVDVAMEADPAFGSGWSRSAVTRDLVLDAVSGAASRTGLDFRPVNGSGRELRSFSGATDRRYRVRRARRQTDGTLIISASAESALATSEDSLLDVEQWAFAWISSSSGLIEEVLIAEVLGVAEGRPGHLVLGRTIGLDGSDMPSAGFRPADEGLAGFDDEEGLGEDFDSSAS